MFDEYSLYSFFLIVMFITAPITFISLLYIVAPYGRHARKGWGPTIPAKLSWVIMELPAVLVIPYFFYLYPQQTVAYVFLIMWEIHYINRTFIFPFRLRNPKPTPIAIPLMGIFFNFINGYVNGFSLTVIHHYTVSWLYDPRFIIGFIIFFVGFFINLQADRILRTIRAEGGNKYQIPQGGLYRWVSSPNYLGEVIEWIGWAIATWSLAGLAFALWTIANLVPRALAHHKWYHEKFPDYPKERKAILFWIL